MKVSHNELTALCSRAFEGLGFPPGTHEDAAEMVVWLEQHGLGGIDALWRGLDHLKANTVQPMNRVFEDASVTVIDAAGNSVLVCGSLAADLVYTKARRKGLAVVKLQRCYNRKLMLGCLAHCARRGMNLMAFWRDREDPVVVEQVVSIRAGEEYPTLLLYRVDDPCDAGTRNRSVTLIASPNFSLLQALKPDLEEAALIEALGPDDFRTQSRRVWEDGLEVEGRLWSGLKELSALTLVESTDMSRLRGAGERGDADE